MGLHRKSRDLSLEEAIAHATDEGPQTVEGEDGAVAVVISQDDYRALRRSNSADDLIAFFATWPSLEGIDLARDRDGDGERTW